MSNRYQSSAATLHYIPEVTPNVIPANPGYLAVRTTGEHLKVMYSTKRSEELTGHRDVADVVVMDAEASGSFDYELSYGAFDALFAAGLYSNWVADVLQNGIVPTPLGFEVGYHDGTGANLYKRLSGCYIDKFGFNIKPSSIITGKFDIMGRTAVYDSAIVTGATYTPAATNPIETGADFGSLSLGGLVIECLSDISMEVDNNLRAQKCLGSNFPSGVGFGDFVVKGNIEMYLTQAQLPVLTAFTNSTRLALAFTVGDTTLQKYKFEMDVKIADVEISAQKSGSDVVAKCKYEGIRGIAGVNLGKTLTITRAVV